METIWMKTGVDVGLVICPFSEKIYIFENEKKTRHALSSTGYTLSSTGYTLSSTGYTASSTGYTTQSIHEDFSHPLLPEYSDNFGKYLEE